MPNWSSEELMNVVHDVVCFGCPHKDPCEKADDSTDRIAECIIEYVTMKGFPTGPEPSFNEADAQW
jgi:hypothetical protein